MSAAGPFKTAQLLAAPGGRVAAPAARVGVVQRAAGPRRGRAPLRAASVERGQGRAYGSLPNASSRARARPRSGDSSGGSAAANAASVGAHQ